MGFNIPYTDKKRVVIIGGGFGGLKLAEKLKKSKFQVVLIDKNNYHQFPPLLYQVASSGLEYNEISFPYRKIFQKRKNFYFRLAEVYGVNPTSCWNPTHEPRRGTYPSPSEGSYIPRNREPAQRKR